MTSRIIHVIGYLTLGLGSAQALVIRAYNAQRHDRFTGFPNTPVFNVNFMHASYDLTGVGWDTSDTRRQLTMISPIHFVGANHFKPAVNATIRFLSADGTLKDFTVVSRTNINNDAGEASDLFIGTLNRPILPNEGICFHPYHNLNSEWNYNGLPTIFLGKMARGAHGVIATIEDAPPVNGMNITRTLRMDYDVSDTNGDDAYMESGDSGSPVFIGVNGVAAIVGTNSIVGTYSNGNKSNWCNFVPHYAEKLNTVMAAQGYQMTKTNPGSTTLTLTHQITTNTPLRAGYPVNIEVTLTNTGNTIAENIKLKDTPTLNATASTSTGTAWFDESTSIASQARKANLTTNGSSTCTFTLIPTASGSVQHEITYTSDQTSSATTSLSFNVIESFISWGSNLTDKSETGDDDQDGINNLLEYAFGGDPNTASNTLPGTTTSLLPTFSVSGNTLHFSYIRRTDYIARAITYTINTSTSLESGSWSNASSMITQTTVSPINSDFELVTATLSEPENNQTFFCLDVSLNE